MQTTPYKYLTEYRLAKAAELLRSTDEPIGHIADSVGFLKSAISENALKEKTGLSPRAYRKNK